MRDALGKAGLVLFKALMMATFVLFAAGGLRAADEPVALTPVIDNARVIVWSLHLRKGETGPYTPQDLDTVVMYLKGGRIRSAMPDGRSQVQMRRAGDAVWVPKGSSLRDTPLTAGPVEEVVIALKDTPVAPLLNSSGLPAAFPRPGSRKVLENARVIVWQYAWVPGRPTPMHFHDKDVVVAFLQQGTLQSVSPTGERTANTYHPGEIRFNARSRSHSEQLIAGSESAEMVELK